jgi:molybdate transport system substrate-binding protein
MSWRGHGRRRRRLSCPRHGERPVHALGPLRMKLAALLGALLLPACPRGAPEPPPVRVAAAADLMLAFEELGRVFEERTGKAVSFSFGSTGLLAKQLQEGAPFDLFAAASASFVQQVVAAGACDGSTALLYARGRLAMWARAGGLVPPSSLAGLEDGAFTRVAIANPEHAPYGQAAREALLSAGLWDAVRPRLVYGENVRQALQLAETGNTEVALTALALVRHDRDNPWVPLDESAHEPIEQVLIACHHGEDAAGGRAFAELVESPVGQEVLLRRGFAVPGEQKP